MLADGSLVELGGGAREAPGYDLVGLFVGSEGCFGIAAEIEVALLPVPEAIRTLLGIFDRIEDSGRAVSDIVSAGLLPAAMEIIDGPTIRAVEDSVFAAGYPTDAEAALVIEFDGLEAGLDEDAARASELCRRAGAREIRTAKDEDERLALWKGRKKAFGAMGRIAPDLLVQDATVPRTTLPSILRGIAEIARRYDLVVANVFHAGDGNLHPNILFDRRIREDLERVERASKEIMRLCVDAGGTITGEHGVGLDKKHHMPLIYGPAELDAMWGLRRVFDPAGVMNPGKVLPEDTDPELPGAGRGGGAHRTGGPRAPHRPLRGCTDESHGQPRGATRRNPAGKPGPDGRPHTGMGVGDRCGGRSLPRIGGGSGGDRRGRRRDWNAAAAGWPRKLAGRRGLGARGPGDCLDVAHGRGCALRTRGPHPDRGSRNRDGCPGGHACAQRPVACGGRAGL